MTNEPGPSRPEPSCVHPAQCARGRPAPDRRIVCGALFGLCGGAWFAGGEELRQLIAAKCVTEHAKGAWGVAKALGRLGGGEPFDVEGAQGLVLALAG